MKEKNSESTPPVACAEEKSWLGGIPLFYRVTIERFGVRLNAIERQQGLTMMLGGSAVLAAVMGPDEDMTQPLMEPLVLTVCENCSTQCVLPIAVLAERET